MPDDSKGVITLAVALRSWPDDELQAAATGTLPDFAEAARCEQQRRARPCTCFLGQPPKRDCPRHEGRP